MRLGYNIATGKTAHEAGAKEYEGADHDGDEDDEGDASGKDKSH